MVNLRPGMQAVDSRSRASASRGEPGPNASPGAAMWMPTRSISPVRWSEKASSISLVPTSSRLKARTSASGRPFGGDGGGAHGGGGRAGGGGGLSGRGNASPAREELVDEALQVVFVRIGQEAA